MKPTKQQRELAREIVETSCGTDYLSLTGGDFKRSKMMEETAIAQALADEYERGVRDAAERVRTKPGGPLTTKELAYLAKDILALLEGGDE